MYIGAFFVLISGRHTIDVQFAGVQVDGSPFYVDVFDLSTIRVDNFRHGTVGDEAGFSGMCLPKIHCYLLIESQIT